MALGTNIEEIVETEDPISISRTYNFDKPTLKQNEINVGIMQSAAEVYSEMIKKGFFYKTVTLNIVYDDYTATARSKSHSIYTDDRNIFEKYAHDLILTTDLNKKIRKISTGVSNLKKIDKRQTTLFDFL